MLFFGLFVVGVGLTVTRRSLTAFVDRTGIPKEIPGTLTNNGTTSDHIVTTFGVGRERTF